MGEDVANILFSSGRASSVEQSGVDPSKTPQIRERMKS
jgi:hypothetical protein